MATASRKTSTPVPTATDVPVTNTMLGKVRTEVLQRIDQAREEARADNQRLDAKIDAGKADVQGVKAEIHDLKEAFHGMQAQLTRMEVLIEAQDARNKIVLDGITALLSRQNQVEDRVRQVEDTVRDLAAARATSKPE